MDTSTTLPSSPVAVGVRNVVSSALRAPFETRTWRETLYLLLNLPIGVFTFMVIVAGFATGIGLLITLIGVPIVFAVMNLSRGIGAIERARARALLHVDMPPPYRADPRPDTWWRVHVARLTDPAAWVEVGYHLLLLPVGIFTFTIALGFWVLGYGLVLAPILDFGLPEHPIMLGRGWVPGTPVEYAVLVLLGVFVILCTPWIIRGLATANRVLVRGMLGSDIFLRERTLTQTRAAAVDQAAVDRRRIERDLHDGVQQRLVSLAMDLGRAKEKLDTDPARAKDLVIGAHEAAKLAIVELRDLARGIHPAVLSDRGLDAALSALAAGSPVPVDVSVEVAVRPPASTEATAYFVVAEALTNAMKHAKASKIDVAVRRSGDRLTVQVRDDGVGGATFVEGSGLTGLRDRVRALDGEIRVLSPAGGPTVLLAEIPCAS